ncbi:hypothetical protein [Streptomyces xantholiticus]|uniref:Uncharacterized protein n=1 Tax=Streptomyces xantholiticus TaxID=68285 RepID=A0ABV1V630_9ACTN
MDPSGAGRAGRRAVAPQLPVLPARLREDRCPHPEPVHLGFVPNGTTG